MSAPTEMSVWLILAERLATIKRLRLEEEARREKVCLVFDGDDQARVVTG